MFFFCLALFLGAVWILPWWGLTAAAALAGYSAGRSRFAIVQAMLAGALSWPALAFVKDGRAHGMISQKLSMLFGLPSIHLLFLILAILGALSVVFPFAAGRAIAQSRNK